MVWNIWCLINLTAKNLDSEIRIAKEEEIRKKVENTGSIRFSIPLFQADLTMSHWKFPESFRDLGNRLKRASVCQLLIPRCSHWRESDCVRLSCATRPMLAESLISRCCSWTNPVQCCKQVWAFCKGLEVQQAAGGKSLHVAIKLVFLVWVA